MSGKCVSLALIPNPQTAVLPELSHQIYYRRSISRQHDSSFRGNINFKTSRIEIPPARGAVRIPLVPANRNGDENVRREQTCFSTKSISPLKERPQNSKGKSVAPGSRAGQENVEPLVQKSKPPPSSRKMPAYQRVRYHLNLSTASESSHVSSSILISPSEPVLKWQHSVRLSFNRRSEMASRPLMIVQFEGVVGDFFSPDWSSPVEFFLRPGWAKGLRSLAQFLQVVVFIDLPKKRYEKVSQAIKASGVHIDAVYRRRKKQVAFLQDYSQTLYDFGLKGVSTSHVMLLSALQLDQAEINSRTEWSLLYEASLSSHRRICALGLPMSANGLSLLWLVPNPRAQELHECISFEDIATVLLKFMDLCPGNLIRAFSHVKDKRPYRINACMLPALECEEVPVLLTDPRRRTTSSSIMRVMAVPKGSFPVRPYLLVESSDEALQTSRTRHKSFIC